MSEINDNKHFKVNTVKSMWELKKEYTSYRIFVWLENESDMDIFTQISFSGIKIEGFCSDQTEEEMFFNKPVVIPESIIYDSDVILVYGKEDARKNELQKKYLMNESLLLSFEELFEISHIMWSKETIILYDSIKAAKNTEALLKKWGISVAGSCSVSDRTVSNIFPEKLFLRKEELSDIEYNIVLASAKIYCEESILKLGNRGMNVFVPSKDIFYSAIIIKLWGKMALNLSSALKSKKKIYLYGTDSCYTNAWLTFFQTVGIDLKKIMDDYEDKEAFVSNIYDIFYEDIKDIYIILNKKIGQWESACDFLESLGFGFNKMYTGLYAVSYRHLSNLADITLGHVTSELLENTKYGGFRVYGKEKEGKYKIVILGGSTTTSEAYRVTCWPELLYHKLCTSGCEAIIYNGAVDGYSASDELHKLIRDVGNIQPDLVISFSGINNRFKTWYPYVSGYLINVFDEIYLGNYYRGLKNETLSEAQIWIQQEQMMEAISRCVYQAEFICFAQPMYVSKKVLLPHEKLQFEKNREIRRNDLIYRDEISNAAGQFEWMVDLQNFLDEYPNVFMDEAHVYEEGNQIIADKIYENIITVISKGKEN